MDDMFVREWLDTIPHIEDDLRTGAFEMNCKQCGRPIFESIEGEPICERCWTVDRKSTRLNSSHQIISYAVFCLKKKKKSRSDASTSISVTYAGRWREDRS